MPLMIYKYPLEATDKQVIVIPGPVRFLCVQVQHDKPCLWVLVNTDHRPVRVELWTVGTGHEFPRDATSANHIGTFQLSGGDLVFHVFKRCLDWEP